MALHSRSLKKPQGKDQQQLHVGEAASEALVSCGEEPELDPWGGDGEARVRDTSRAVKLLGGE